MTDNKKENSLDWLSVSLGIVCVLLIACNIALMKKYRWETLARKKLEMQNKKLKLEKKRRRDNILKQALVVQSSQEMEFRFLRHALEEALEYYKKGDHKKVIEALERDEYDYSALPMAYYLRASSYAALQRDEQAIQDFSTYLSLVFFSCYAHLKRAQVYYHMGETEAAIEDLQKALNHRPDFTPAKILLKKWQRERNGEKQRDK